MAVRKRIISSREEKVAKQNSGNHIERTTKIIKLYSYEEIPDWQKDNSYIHHGYVMENNSFKECFDSLFYLHNETVNIYTHLIPGLTFGLICVVGIFFIYYLNHFYFPLYPTTTWKDIFIISIFISGCATTLCLSSYFHCFKAHSPDVAKIGNKLDYLGIILLIVSSMISINYYAFYNHPNIRNFFWGITFIFGLACSIVTLLERFRTTAFRAYRATMFVMFGLSGVFPIIYGALMFDLDEFLNRSQFKWILLEGIFYCFGAFLYAMRIPERFNPGGYDLFGHSHQIFHVLVVIAACCHGKGLLDSYKFTHEILK